MPQDQGVTQTPANQATETVQPAAENTQQTQAAAAQSQHVKLPFNWAILRPFLTPYMRITDPAVREFTQRVGGDIVWPIMAGGRLGAGLGLLGGVAYALETPERRRKWFKNMLLYGGLGLLGGSLVGSTLAGTLGPLYALYRAPTHAAEIASRAPGGAEAGMRLLKETPHMFQSFLDQKARAALYKQYTLPAVGAGLGFLAGTTYALGSRERRKEWFKNLLIYSTLGTIAGFAAGPAIGSILFPAYSVR